MATMVDAVEPHHVQPSPKVPKFGTKTGFVIPKNKLSGSLVPMFRSGGKSETSDIVDEESSKKLRRKTKWGTDLTQDAAVRKGRLLAYQSRLDQITEQLKQLAQESESDKSLKSQLQPSVNEVTLGNENQEREHLELEKREIIGEILQLNPKYKPPADYKPLLKEAKVPIPIKEYPGYNFIGLLLGTESNPQKRLEEETGAKIRIHGTKAETGEKLEITKAEETDTQTSYEELYVHVSADTFEKVDAAVSLVELLVTPASVTVAANAGNVTSGGSADVTDPSPNDPSSSYIMMPMTSASKVAVQPVVMPSQSASMQYQSYPGAWYPRGLPNIQMQPPTGTMHPQMTNNSLGFSPSPSPSVNVNRPPFFTFQHPFTMTPRNLPGNLSSSQPPMQHPSSQATSYPNPSVPLQQPSINPSSQAQPSNFPSSFPAMIQLRPSQFFPSIRTSLPQSPHPSNTALALPPPVTTLTGWTGTPSVAASTIRPTNPQIVTTTSAQPQGSHIVPPQNSNLSFHSQQSMPTQMSRMPPGANFSAPHIFLSQPPATSVFSPIPYVTGAMPAAAVVSSSMSSIPAHAHSQASLNSPRPGPWSLSLSVRPSHSGLQVPVFASASPSSSVQVSSSALSASLPLAPPPVAVHSLAPRQLSGPAVPIFLPSRPSSGSSGTVSEFDPQFGPSNSAAPRSISISSVTVSNPPRTGFGDFTFQPLRAHVSAPLASPSLSNQPAARNTPQMSVAAVQTPVGHDISQFLRPLQVPLTQSTPLVNVPHAPSFRPAMQNPVLPVGGVGFPPPQAFIPPASSGTVITHSSDSVNVRPPGPLPFPNPQISHPLTMLNQRAPPRFLYPLQTPMQGSAVISTLTMMPPPRGQLAQTTHAVQLHSPLVQNQQMSKPTLGPGRNQVYDPFSPTSISNAPQKGDPTKAGKLEPDAEYEDLMASVGVK